MKIKLIFEKDKKSKSLMKLQLNDLTIPMSEKDLQTLVNELFKKREDLFEESFAHDILNLEIERQKEEIEDLNSEIEDLNNRIDDLEYDLEEARRE